MTQAQFIQELYEFLRNHIDASTLEYYSHHYTYSSKSEPICYGFLKAAFEWSATPEGHNYWLGIARLQPSHLYDSSGVDLTLQQLIDAVLILYNNEQQSYEYW